jgi:6-phosphogluconolactonase
MPHRTLVFAGSVNRPTPYFGGANGHGISVFDFDEASGKLALLGERGGIDNPTFLTVDPASRRLYATSEVFGWNEGLVTAFAIDAASGTLRYINKQPTLGSIAAHCSFDRSGRFLIVVNYSMDDAADAPGQSVVVFPLRDDGGLAPPVSSVRHTGSGPVQARQEGPHPHCAAASPDNRVVVVSDLGIDRLLAYRFAAATGHLGPQPSATVALPGGSGPRHLAFHPDGRVLYAIGELGGAIAVLSYAPEDGRMAVVQSVPAVPEGFVGESHCADLLVNAAGTALYGSNRGNDSIAAYAIDPASGRLTLVGHVSSGGRTPRNLALDPSGRFLLAANQDSDSIVVFRIDPATGALAPAGPAVACGTPMALRLARCAEVAR